MIMHIDCVAYTENKLPSKINSYSNNQKKAKSEETSMCSTTNLKIAKVKMCGLIFTFRFHDLESSEAYVSIQPKD
jgi:hypothetical protein